MSGGGALPDCAQVQALYDSYEVQRREVTHDCNVALGPPAGISAEGIRNVSDNYGILSAGDVDRLVHSLHQLRDAERSAGKEIMVITESMFGSLQSRIWTHSASSLMSSLILSVVTALPVSLQLLQAPSTQRQYELWLGRQTSCGAGLGF